MIAQDCDDDCVKQRAPIAILQRSNQSYYVEMPALTLYEQSRLIEQVIQFALDTLGARHLDMRVVVARDMPGAIAHEGIRIHN